jgi:Ser/Thr protein kinase RdoA (MazF antagonist)
LVRIPRTHQLTPVFNFSLITYCFNTRARVTPMTAINTTPYANLNPDTILEALESVDLAPNGGLLALNSYENRVYQAELDDGTFVVVKFYRPNRWSAAAIEEEHKFTFELLEAEISVVAPLQIASASLFEYAGFQFAVYPRQGGHPPNLENEDDLEVLARTIGRMHAVGAQATFSHRAALTTERLGTSSRTYLLDNQFVPLDLENAYATLTTHLLDRITPIMQGLPNIRIHGDCHMGNVLWRSDTPHFVDFDDCVMGPPIQDLWMLLSGERSDQTLQLNLILDAYTTFFDFDSSTLGAIEALRTLRIMHHAAWIARRWQDPAFPQAFPWFESPRFWSDHLLELREQLALLDEPPLTYF